MLMSDYVIKTQDLTKLYAGDKGCREITLRVRAAWCMGFWGRTERGKVHLCAPYWG